MQKFASLGWHIFMIFIQILVKLHTQYMQYLLDLLGIKWSGFLGIFVVCINASERHDIGEKKSISDISLNNNLYMSSPDLFSSNCNSRKESPERSNVSSEQMVLTSIPTVLFKLPALAMAQLKLILEQCYKKKQKQKEKEREKGVENLWNRMK